MTRNDLLLAALIGTAALACLVGFSLMVEARSITDAPLPL